MKIILSLLILSLAPLLAQQQVSVQPDCFIAFTFPAGSASFPATVVNNGPGDNRQKGCSAWTMKYQSTGYTVVSVQVDSGADTGTAPTFGAFAGTVKSGFANPVVSNTGGETQLTNGTATISWVRVTATVTGAGALTGVLYGWRNSSAAIGGGSGGTCGALGGDVTGTCAASTVIKINNTQLSSLATGLLKNTTGTGVPSIAVASDLPGGPYLPLAGGTMVGNILFTDNMFDIGASGATRPRNLFLAAKMTSATATVTGLGGSGTVCVNADNSGNLGGAGAPCANTVFTATFTNQTSITMSHNFGTNNLTFACYNAGTPPVWIEPNTVTETDTNTLTVTFTNSQSGHCTIVAQGGPGGGGGITGLNVAAPITTTGGSTPTIGINNFGGDSGAGGTNGAVPAPPAGSAALNWVLQAGGAWGAQTSGTSTIIIVTGHGNHTTNATIANEFFSSCDSSSGVVTLSLPVTPTTGEVHNLKKIDSSGNPCIINGNGKNIDGGASTPLGSQYSGISVYYDGTQWWVI